MPVLRPASCLILACLVAGCSLFAPSKPTADLSPKGGYPTIANDWRGLVPEVTGLEVAPTTTGAIVSARGLPPTQGYWGAELVPENQGQPVNGVITYRFVLANPPAKSPDSQRVATPWSREVTAGAFINSTRFAQTTKVVVIGANGSRSAGR